MKTTKETIIAKRANNITIFGSCDNEIKDWEEIEGGELGSEGGRRRVEPR